MIDSEKWAVCQEDYFDELKMLDGRLDDMRVEIRNRLSEIKELYKKEEQIKDRMRDLLLKLK